MPDYRYRYEKANRRKKTYSNNRIYAPEKEKSIDDYLKKLHGDKHFDRKLYEQGIEYFNLGGILEEARDDLRTNEAFCVGYAHAKRLAHVNELQEKNNTENKIR